MEIIFETERLILRKLDLEDDAFIVILLNTPQWLQYIGDRNVHSLADARAYLLKGPMASYDKNGFGLSLVALKDTGTPIGMCGLLRRDTLDAPDIGFAFLPEYAGKGYGYEIASSLITYARKTWNLNRILAITLPDNLRSLQLLKKMGFQFERNITFNNEDLLLLVSEPPMA